MSQIITLNNKTEIKEDKVFILSQTNIKLTEKAVKQFYQALITDDERKEFIRIGVKGGGCVGFQYNLEFINEEDIDKDEDLRENIAWEDKNITFIVDIFSKEYLKDTTIDYIISLSENGFKFINYNIKKSCGCSQSFSV